MSTRHEQSWLVVADSNESNNLSEMPCHLNGDVHEGRNEVATVPSCNPLNFLSGAKARDFQWEVKTPWNFTVV